MSISIALPTVAAAAPSTKIYDVVATVPVGTSPFLIASAPDDSKVYVSNSGSSSLSVIDSSSRIVSATIPTGPTPAGIAPLANGEKLFVTNFTTNAAGTGLDVISTSTNALDRKLSAPNRPLPVVAAPDSRTVFWGSSSQGGSISWAETDATTTGGLDYMPLGTCPPLAMAMTPDGSHIYASCLSFLPGEGMKRFDTATKTYTTLAQSTLVTSLAIAPDGSRLFQAGANTLAVRDTRTNTVTRAVSVPAINHVTMSADGQEVYASTTTGNVLVFDVETLETVATISVGGNLQGITALKSGTWIYVANQTTNSVNVISIVSPSVTFDANGGSGEMAGQSSSSPAALRANSFTRANHVFQGWNTSPDGTGLSYDDEAEFPFTARTTTLYAIWTEIPDVSQGPVEVTFDANGGIGSMPLQVGREATALLANRFTKSGFAFAGWNTRQDGSGIRYADGALYPFAVSVRLFAQWVDVPPMVNTVLFNANGGTGMMTPQLAASAAALQPNAFQREGFRFLGWNTAANGSGSSYADRASFPFELNQSTLYAQWMPNPPTSVVAGTSEIARTGADPVGPAGAGILLMFLGAAIALARRRSKHSH